MRLRIFELGPNGLFVRAGFVAAAELEDAAAVGDETNAICVPCARTRRIAAAATIIRPFHASHADDVKERIQELRYQSWELGVERRIQVVAVLAPRS